LDRQLESSFRLHLRRTDIATRKPLRFVDVSVYFGKMSQDDYDSGGDNLNGRVDDDDA
jgi:hypothetical protein